MSKKGGKERLMAIVLGLVMVVSMGGFALSSAVYTQESPQDTIPEIVERELSPGEKIFVLRTGRVLIESFYQQNCTECVDLNMMLRSFVASFKEYAVLEQVVANSTLVQIIGRGGLIEDIPLNVSQQGLMDMFCELAIKQPTQCLLKDY